MLPRDAAPPVIQRLAYRPPSHLVDDVELRFELDPGATRVSARFAYRRNPGAEPGATLLLCGEQLKLIEVGLDGRPLAPGDYELSSAGITFRALPDTGVLHIVSECEPAANRALEGLYLSSGVFCTQCEPEGFRRIAFFQDRPDVLARYTVTIVADSKRYPVLLSNGNLIERGAVPGNEGRHYAIWHDPYPKPSYLFALVAGDLASLDDEFVTASGRKVALRIFSTPAKLAKCRHAMAALKRAMRWDEERYGREYDLDTFMIFCADDFNMGAMENKGLNIFNSKLLLANPETATDADYSNIEGVVAHEYFHNWTGNRVTCRDWFQLSLKEGLTVFRDQEYSSDVGSRAVERIEAVDFLRAQQFAEDAGPTAHPVRPDSYAEINNFYTATVYEKGAEVIRMQRALLGDKGFRRGMDLYFERHDGHAVTCDDFVQAMQDSSGIDLAQFRLWYSQAGTPTLAVKGDYDAAAQTFVLEVAQSCPPTPGQPGKRPLHIPLAVGLVGSDGNDLPLHLDGEGKARASSATTAVLHVKKARESFRFVDVREPPVPSLLRGFSAPVKVEYDYSEAALGLLAAHDSDPVCRWDAAQRIFSRAILGVAGRGSQSAAFALPPAVVDVVRALLADRTSDPALLALALKPPRLSVLADRQTPIDIDALHRARMGTTAALARELASDFEDAYAVHRSAGAYSAAPAEIARRSLKNVCLAYLTARDDADSHALALAQFDAADNMTDAIAALAALNDTAAGVRDVAMARFETRWRDNPLVMDKWLALQATSCRPGTLERVRALLSHPVYDAHNPNRIRSLVGAFAQSNLPAFHAADGGGYVFVADQVLTIDRSNPQVAARLVAAFNRWRRFDAAHGALQRAALERIAAAPALSTDVAEIVAHNLAD
ncbi:MAG TPA: aminopeptidase N [Casimicrobiaceae bacterium]|nr:aminopeptidase N [Casimicrobiaceae bacterium]